MKKKIIFFILCLFAWISVYAQKGVTVTGTVVDSNGIPLRSASVYVRGSTEGTITDVNGSYMINVPEGSTLVYSFAGMQSQEVIVGDQTSIDITLSYMELEEVIIVELGYNSKRKSELTGSSVQVGAKDVNRFVSVSPDQALQGKVTGLTLVSPSGTPGTLQHLRIRGVGSYTASNEPLFIIDGIPIVNQNISGLTGVSTLSGLSGVDNEHIESISVLKDPSVTSPFGARGSNGVIVITTKKGRKGKTQYSVTSTIGFQNAAVDGPDVLTATKQEELFYDGVFNTYGDGGKVFSREEAKQYAENSLKLKRYKIWNDNGRPEGDWDEAIKNKNALITSQSISATGGSELYSFYVSLNYNYTEAIVIGSKFERITGIFNFKTKLSEKFDYYISLKASSINQKPFLEATGFYANPYFAKFFIPSTETPYTKDGKINTNLNAKIFNPLYLEKHDLFENDIIKANVSSSLAWEVIDQLTLKTKIGLDYDINAYKNHSNRHYGDTVILSGSTHEKTYRHFNWVIQNSLNYKNTFDDHTFDITLLQEYQKDKKRGLEGYGESFPTDGLTVISVSRRNQMAGSEIIDWANSSYLALLNYDYDKKYIFDASLRREGSSRFAPGNRFGYFWSVGTAWNIKKESFMDNVDFINVLKLRASYGISGNNDIGSNKYQPLLSFDVDYDDKGGGYNPADGYGNKNLTWEKNRSVDMGIDFSIVNNRIFGSFVYYHKKTYDLLQGVPLSYTTGFETILRNSGEVVNKGIEMELSFAILKMKDLSWNLSCNLSTVNNEVKQLAKDPYGNDINITDSEGRRKIAVGHPIYEWHMRKWAGVNSDNGNPQWYKNGIDGDITEIYSEAKAAFQGTSAIPEFSGGISTSVDYKGIFFNANIYFAGGHQILEQWAGITKSNGLNSIYDGNGTTALLSSWKKPGDITDYPALQANTSDGNSAAFTSSRFLYDGDYARLRELTVGYRFPGSLMEKLGFVNGITCSIKGTNILTWVKDNRLEYDPEVSTDGFIRINTPPVKSYVFSVNIKF